MLEQETGLDGGAHADISRASKGGHFYVSPTRTDRIVRTREKGNTASIVRQVILEPARLSKRPSI